jgi:hypothetical protein
MAYRMLVLPMLVLVTLLLGACGGNPTTAPAPAATSPAVSQASAAPPATGAVSATATTEPAQPASAASAALKIPCAELVPAEELERILGAKASNLLETAMPGWTACTWFYSPPNATQQAEFIAQAYTGEETLVKWRMDTAKKPSGVDVKSLAGYTFEGYTWVIPESKLRAVQALQDGRYVFLRFPADNPALSAESGIADYLTVLFRRLQEKG